MVGQRTLAPLILVRFQVPEFCGKATYTMWFVYIIKSLNKKWYYVGSTNRLEERVKEHNKGLVRSSKPYRPFRLIFKKSFESEAGARFYERKLKDCRIEKERIIKGLENND